ncbi:MAG TPA: serine/threonine-protein kinase, partial [Kofleriaceae bacterium]|nr:serine/threonine-protein kinase [Kofleriaceae bacterium]
MKGLAAVGDVLAGKYRVDKILGIGGMGMVVAATHLEIDQRVALKFMLPGSHESPESSARFLREARAAGRLNSEHVCRVSDVGRFDNGAPYIVMEYLQGENLGAILRRRGPLRVADAVDYVLQAIEGLAEAHAHGIIHRDLKPDNLFFHKRNDGGGTVKILDFGISKISIEGLSTKTGDIMGSPAYMAPEQMESTRNVDHRADIWSIGVVLYQLVVGHPPFQGDTLPLLCMHVVNDEPTAMSAIRADLPEGFEAVVMRCLRKEPEERFADVGELARALAPFGPKDAHVSASRIQIVLRRTHKGSSPLISTDFTRVSPDDVALPGVPHVIGREATTFSATAGQSMSTERVDRSSRGFAAGLVLALAAAALIIVVVWRGGGGLEHSAAARDPKPAPVGVEPPAARPPGPIVEPIIEDT